MLYLVGLERGVEGQRDFESDFSFMKKKGKKALICDRNRGNEAAPRCEISTSSLANHLVCKPQFNVKKSASAK